MRNVIFAINITLDGCCDHTKTKRRCGGNVAKDALFHLGNGTVASKQDLLAHMHQKVMEDSLEMTDTMFSPIGDVAIFSYVFRRTRHDDDGAVIRGCRRVFL